MGNRVPTANEMVMIRLVGTRATYMISSRSRTLMDDDSCTRSTSSSTWVWAKLQNGVDDR